MTHTDLTPKDEKTYAIMSYNGKTWMQEWNKEEAESYIDHITSEGEEGRRGAKIIAVLRGKDCYSIDIHEPSFSNQLMLLVLGQAEL